jgi:hypothetical protein
MVTQQLDRTPQAIASANGAARGRIILLEHIPPDVADTATNSGGWPRTCGHGGG